MVTHMKTTIDIADSLFEQARKAAAKDKTTFKAVVEASLRQYLARHSRPQARFKLKDGSFRGQGLQAGLREGDWRQVRAMIYEGRGA
jgi:hypothetical protein